MADSPDASTLSRMRELETQNELLECRLQEIQLQSQVLLEIAKALNASLDVRVIAANIISAIVSLIPVDKATVCLYQTNDQALEVIGAFDSATINPHYPDDLDLTFALNVLHAGKIYYNPAVCCGDPWDWICCIPMCSAQGYVGTINIHCLRQGSISTEQLAFLETVAGHAALALQNAILFTIVERESITDGLTGAYNFRYFQKRLREYLSLSQRRKQESQFGLLIFDIDYFKQFNDQFGHQFGDQVLKTIVKALSLNLRVEDLLARYGGEEFVLLIPGAGEQATRFLSERVRYIVEHIILLHAPTGTNVSVTVSVGATLWQPLDNVTSLIERADKALYKAKQQGRNQSVFA